MRRSPLQQSFEIPNPRGPDRRPLALVSDAPPAEARILDTFGVPWVLVAHGDAPPTLSRAAELLRASGTGARVIAQAERLGRSRCDRRPSDRDAGDAGCDGLATGRYRLTPHDLRGGLHQRGVLVTILPAFAPGQSPSIAGLTPRELEVATLIGQGEPTKCIARALGISPHTARHHTERVFAKLGVRSRVAVALLLAERMGGSSHGPETPARAL